MRKLAAVSGYATLDYPVRLPRPLTGPGTSSVEALDGDGWPRAGGAALYTSRRIAAAGHRAAVAVTIGNDANGLRYLDACRAANVDVAGVSSSSRVRTPWCALLYHDDGSYTCLIDRDGVDDQLPTRPQQNLLSQADYVCIAAGPAAHTVRLMEGLADDVPLAWIAKRDAVSLPDTLAARLASRADIIFCNASERTRVDWARGPGMRAGQSIVETRGTDGVVLERLGERLTLPCELVPATDTTGAGDTLAGEVIATLLSETSNLEDAVCAGIEAVREMLLRRPQR